MNYTAEGLACGDTCYQLEDITFLPVAGAPPWHPEFYRKERPFFYEEWFKKLVKPYEKSRELRCLALDSLQNQYNDHRIRNKGGEPEWIHRLDTECRRSLRVHFMHSDGVDPLSIVPFLPNAGFGYVVHEDGLIHDAVRTFRLFRLNGIRQLAFLHAPVPCAEDEYRIEEMFPHTRYVHSLDVAATATLIVANNPQLTPHLHNARFAGITHDALTPAGGDSTKLVDLDVFDEDKHYPLLFEHPEWPELRDKYFLSESILREAVLGNGIVGRVLDTADKIAYIGRDARNYLSQYYSSGDPSYQKAFSAISSLVKDNPYICSIWDSVQVEDNQLVMGDCDRLGKFLLLRAYMFRELYYNPNARLLEYVMATALIKYMYVHKLVTREELLIHDDQWLERKMDEVVGISYWLTTFRSIHDHLSYESFGTIDEARCRVSEFDSDESTLSIIDDFRCLTKTGADKFLVKKDGRIMTFAEACPEQTHELEAMLKKKDEFRVCVFSLDHLKIAPMVRTQLKEMVVQGVRQKFNVA